MSESPLPCANGSLSDHQRNGYLPPAVREDIEAERFAIGCLLMGFDDDRLHVGLFPLGICRTLFDTICRVEAEGLLQSPSGDSPRQLNAAAKSNIHAVVIAAEKIWNGKPADLRSELAQCYSVATLPELLDHYVGRLERTARVRRLSDAMQIGLERLNEQYADLDELESTFISSLQLDDGGSKFLRGTTSAEFFSQEYSQTYISEGAVADGQNVIVGGGCKTLKTSIVLDLCISIATSTKFLNHFPCNHHRRIGIISGESGQRTLQETAKRICRSKGDISPTDLDIIWEFDIPTITDSRHERALRRFIKRHRLQILVLDPAYLAFSAAASSAPNLFGMGAIIGRFAALCASMGCQPMVLHHFGKSAVRVAAASFAPPSLEDLSMAGFAEFARQWALLARRDRYELGSGVHRLWLNLGGSAGHGSLWGVDIDEGRIDDAEGRKWEVTVSEVSQVVSADATRQDDIKQEAQQRRDDIARERVMQYLTDNPDGDTANAIFAKCKPGIAKTRFKDVLIIMQDDGDIEEAPVRKHTRDESGFRRPA